MRPTGPYHARMTGTVDAELIRDTERRRLRALVNGGVDEARALHSDDYQLVTPGGVTMSKQDYLGGIASGELDYLVFESASEVHVRVYEGAAVVRYQARIEILVKGERDAGLFWHTDLYELRVGRWQAVWSQATRIRQ